MAGVWGLNSCVTSPLQGLMMDVLIKDHNDIPLFPTKSAVDIFS